MESAVGTKYGNDGRLLLYASSASSHTYPQKSSKTLIVCVDKFEKRTINKETLKLVLSP